MTQQTFAATSAASSKRARISLIFTSVLFAIWVAAMIAMYAKTVYPDRHPTVTKSQVKSQ